MTPGASETITGSIDALFSGAHAPVSDADLDAASALAAAFATTPEPEPHRPTPLPGTPAHRAPDELSLDHVFRGAPEGAPPADGGFSFDQFFSDSRASGGDVAAPATAAPETGRSSTGSGDAHDIEQFTAWLEGLKKK